ncbi:non-functional pseudokinase ZED1-like [Telopea speciosissima]|uniref:non-functional pseudokinase ZED1-like n=1 Tax=Telopea speciosissima TaxID=54955 RepID=UPI001CC78FD3|nr:non-functional pseudokinase ZED1-like [Telopea speciosissima]
MCSWLSARKKRETKERSFLKNGGQILEELIASCDGKCNPIQTFSEKELNRATNNYNQDRILFMDWGYALYKGNYRDRNILVKKYLCKLENHNEICTVLDGTVNEIVIGSQMNHKNVLKLLGYCLETQIPIQVYEFAPHGDLYSQVCASEPDKPSILTTQLTLNWENRLRIATEVADAITYLHMAGSRPIIHRDIKPSNIFLDQHCVAKLSDFTHSIRIPLGEMHVKDDIRGTFGFIAPEYCKTGLITEKADVFSFGMLLLEILMGRTPLNFQHPAEDLDFTFWEHVRSFVENNPLSMIVEPAILEEKGIEEQLQAFTKLAMRCIPGAAEERPTMMEVAKELRQIRRCLSPVPAQ